MNKKKKLIIYFPLFFLIYISNLYSKDKHENLLNLLESNYPAEFFFKQASKDSFSEGWMIIEGKGKARIEFSPPNNTLIVANGKWIIFHDPELDRTTYLPLKSGILKALLDPESFQDKKNFTIKETKEGEKIVFIIEFNLEEQKQKIFIYFNKKHLTLLGWKIIESPNNEINVKILDIKKVKKVQFLKKDIFNFTEQMRETGTIYYGPYKREVNKIKDNGKLN
ncbi:outer membrane lipoprotein carrier protein LolA [Alphaproteobacteria bacterium]|nr:outer membrane lipoprotein carrier protein LolA [Alphaproteobacteria bacterium]